MDAIEENVVKAPSPDKAKTGGLSVYVLLRRVDLLTFLDVITDDTSHVAKRFVPRRTELCSSVIFVQDSAEVGWCTKNSPHVKHVGFVFTATNALENTDV